MTLKRWGLEYEVVDLSASGINNFAFDLPSAISYMCEATSNGLLILGGDIIVIDNDRYIESDDNWYSSKTDPTETMQDALNYLRCYWKNCNSDSSTWMVAVILNKWNKHNRQRPVQSEVQSMRPSPAWAP